MAKKEKIEKTEKVFMQAPLKTDSSWNDYVMGLFADEELVEDPKTQQNVPTLPGLRRLAELLIGDIVINDVSLVSAPSEFNARGYAVLCTIEFRNESGSRRVSAIADAHRFNSDPPYNKYLSAIAESRAEARALRKALRLRTVSAEELSNVAENNELDEEWTPSQNISREQEAIINKICKDIDINVVDFLNSGSEKYATHRDVPHSAAARMIKQLNIYRGGQMPVPASLKGYKEGWNK